MARYDLGLSQSEWETISPVEFGELAQRKRDEAERIRKEGQYNAALICSVLANINRDSKKKPSPFQPKDFMPTEVKEKKAQTPEQVAETLKAYTMAMGGKVVH